MNSSHHAISYAVFFGEVQAFAAGTWTAAYGKDLAAAFTKAFMDLHKKQIHLLSS